MPEHYQDTAASQDPPEIPGPPSREDLWRGIQGQLDQKAVAGFSGTGGWGAEDEEEDPPEDEGGSDSPNLSSLEALAPPSSGHGIDFGRLASALGRGAKRGANESADATVSLGRGIAKKATDVDPLFNPEEDEDDLAFINWYNMNIEEANPFRFDVPEERDTGLYGFAEVLSQAVTGMVGWGKYFKGATVAGKPLWDVARFTVAGAATDAWSFDPYEERLANLVEDGPPWMSNVFTEYLAADPEDHEAEARLKAALEGGVIGSTLDAAMYGFRAWRYTRAVKRGDMTPAQRVEKLEESLRGTTPKEPGVPETVTIEKSEDGWTVRPKGPIEGETMVDDDIGAAVVRTAEGNHFRGPIHAIAEAEAQAAGETVVNRDLFRTSEGRYVGREEAAEIAERAEQREFNAFSDPDQLDSSETARGRQAAEAGETEPDIRNTDDLTDEELEARSRELQDELESGGAEEAPTGGVRDTNEIPEVRVKTEAQAKSVAASMDWMVQHSRRAARPETLVDEEVEGFQHIMRQVQDLGPDDLQDLNPDGLFPNFSYYGGSEGAARSIFALSTVIQDALTTRANRAAEGLGVTWDQRTSRALRKVFNSGGEDNLLEILRTGADISDTMNTLKHAGRLYTGWLGQKISHLGRLADDMGENPIFADMLGQALDQGRRAEEFTRQMEAGAGRGLNEQKMPLEAEDLRNFATSLYRGAQEGVEETVEQQGGKHPFTGMSPEEIRNVARVIRLHADDPNKVMEIFRMFREIPAEGNRARRSAGGGAPRMEGAMGLSGEQWDKLITWRTNAMLSGVGTQTVNIMATAVKVFGDPLLVKAWGGIRSNNPGLVVEGLAEELGLFMNLFQSMGSGLKAFREGVPILDPPRSLRNGVDDTLVNSRIDEGIAQSAHLVTDQGPMKFLGSAARVVGTAPGRALMGGDDFLKQLSYRSWVTGQATKQAMQDGIRSPAEFAARIRGMMNESFQKDSGGARRAGTQQRGLEHARRQTFTNRLEWGAGKGIQNMANRNPIARVLFPFVRTPTNILRDVKERTPIVWKWSQDVQAALAEGGEAAAQARAKMETGTAMWALGGFLAASGSLTGRGPSDPVQREQWREAGNEPYTLTVGGVAIPLGRLEPYSLPLILAADFHTAVGEMKEDDAVQAATMGALAIGQTVTNRAYFMTVNDMMTVALSGDDGRATKFLARLGQSMIPNIAMSQNMDEHFREPRGFLEEVLQRTPGFSQDMEPTRGLLGEPGIRTPGYFNRAYMPMWPHKLETDPVLQELVNLEKGFNPPSPEQFGLDWTDRKQYGKEWPGKAKAQSPYDHMLELKGTLSFPEMGTLREAMETLQASEMWEKGTSGSQAVRGGSRWEMANSLIDGYTNAAKALTFSKYNDVLQPHMTAHAVTQAAALLPEAQREKLLEGVSVEATDAITELFGSLEAVTADR